MIVVKTLAVIQAGLSFAAIAFRSGQQQTATEAGSISIHSGVLHFRSEGVSLNIPLIRLQIQLSEETDFQLCLSDASTPGWTICTADESILEHPEMKRTANVRNQVNRLFGGHELKRQLKITGGVLLGCILLAWLGSVCMGLMVRSIVGHVPKQMEEKWSNEALKELKGQELLVDDPQRVAKLEALAKPLLQVAMPGQEPVKFHIMKLSVPNAFALPCGHVVVTTGLLDITQRPEELLGVIAHECAHITQRHALREKISSAGPFLIVAMFSRSGGGAGNLLASGSALLVHQSFSQEYETEADQVGWDYLVAANIDPHGMIDMFHKLQAYEDNPRYRSEVPQAFSSHPATRKRIASLEAKWRKLPVKSGFLELDKSPL